MAGKVFFAVVLGHLIAVAANAQQAFEGVYRGTRTITNAQTYPDCPGIGGRTTSIEFEVKGPSITLKYLLRKDIVFRGSVASSGGFAISTPWVLSGGETATVNWSGKVDGARIDGILHGTGASAVCHGTLTARKRR